MYLSYHLCIAKQNRSLLECVLRLVCFPAFRYPAVNSACSPAFASKGFKLVSALKVFQGHGVRRRWQGFSKPLRAKSCGELQKEEM